MCFAAHKNTHSNYRTSRASAQKKAP